jgi:parallel beta-helix repeat protein
MPRGRDRESDRPPDDEPERNPDSDSVDGESMLGPRPKADPRGRWPNRPGKPPAARPPKPKPPVNQPGPDPLPPRPPDDSVVVIKAGDYRGFPRKLESGKRYVAEGKVVIRGGSDALRVVDLSDVGFEGFVFTGASRAGVFIANSRGVTFKNCESSHNGVQGWLIVDSTDVTLEECIAEDNEKQHGYYNGQTVRGFTMRHCTAARNGRSGLQINSEAGKHGARGVLIEDCLLENNQRAQSGAQCNLMGVGEPDSRFMIRRLICRGPGRSLYAGDYAAERECYGDLNVQASGAVEIESPGVRQF